MKMAYEHTCTADKCLIATTTTTISSLDRRVHASSMHGMDHRNSQDPLHGKTPIFIPMKVTIPTCTK